MTATQEQLAALAGLVGITCYTHPSLAKKDYVYPNGVGHGNPRQLVGVRLDTSKLPALDTDAGDDVFLAPFMRWLGGVNRRSDMWIENFASNITVLNLIRACQSAGVSEIVEIFGRGDHDAR